MKRKSEDAPPSRVYKYGLLDPISNVELIEEQLLLAHRYRNMLTEVGLGRRAAYRVLMSKVGDVAALETLLRDFDAEQKMLRAGIKARSCGAQKRAKPTPEEKARLAEIKAEMKTIRADRKALKLRLRTDPEIKAELDAMNERGKVMRRSLRAACGVHWGTYLLVEAAADQAQRSSTDPSFKPWTGTGRLGGHIVGGMSVDSLAHSSVVQVDPVQEGAWDLPRGERKRATRTRLRLRVGSDGRKPIWAEWPMIMHRPLPADADIKNAFVSRSRVGTRWRWHVCFVVNAQSFVPPPLRTLSRIAVDFGAKGETAGHLVASAVGSDGRLWTLPVDPRIVGGIRKADELHSLRDTLFNEARELLLDMLASAPTWVQERARHASKWRSTRRLVRLVEDWRNEDPSACPELHAWRCRDRHLYQWEANQRAKSLLRRREQVRIWARRLADAYGTLVTEQLNFATTRKTPEAEAEDNSKTWRKQSTKLAPGEARMIVRQAFFQREERLPPNARQTRCASCGKPVQVDRVMSCGSCGFVVDADVGRCIALLKEVGVDTGGIERKVRMQAEAVRHINNVNPRA